MSANEYLISKIKYSKNKYSANGFSTSCIKLRDVNTPFSSLPVISKDTKRKLKKNSKTKNKQNKVDNGILPDVPKRTNNIAYQKSVTSFKK